MDILGELGGPAEEYWKSLRQMALDVLKETEA
jgi:hypothetical protein